MMLNEKKSVVILSCCLLFIFSFPIPSAAKITDAYAQKWDKSKNSEVRKLTENVYAFRMFSHSNIFIVTEQGVIVTDPINKHAAQRLRAEIRKVTDKPVKFVVYSHEHWDHILGAGIFKEEGAIVISHENCIPFFIENPHPDLVMPDITFSGNYELKFGNRVLELHYFNKNHGNCMVVMRLPDEKLLFIVDLVVPKRVAFGTVPDFDLSEWIRTLTEIDQTLEFDAVLPAHGLYYQAPPEVVNVQSQYLKDLMGSVKSAFRKGPLSPESTINAVKSSGALDKYKIGVDMINGWI